MRTCKFSIAIASQWLLPLLSSPFQVNAATVDPEVFSHFEQDNHVRVMVSLIATEDDGEGGRRVLSEGTGPNHQKAIAEVEERVMQSFENGQESLIHKNENIPMMAMNLNRAQVEALSSNVDVENIVFDYEVKAFGPLRGSTTNEVHVTKNRRGESHGARKLLNEANDDVNSGERHALNNRGAGVVVAVLDTGYDRNHPALAGSLIEEYCFLEQGCPATSGDGVAIDRQSHGTHVSSIVTNNDATPGIAPDAGIIAVKVLGDDGTGSYSGIVAALDFLIGYKTDGNPLDVINMSLGTPPVNGICNEYGAYERTFRELRALGVLSIAAAGNDNASNMGAPACISHVLSVGATNTGSTSPAGFTNSNQYTDVFAPGTNIRAAIPGGGFASYSGTSMASPVVAGCAALLIEAGDATTPDDIETRLETSNRRVIRDSMNFPLINCKPNPKARCRTSTVSVGSCDISPSDLFKAVDNGSTGFEPSQVSFTGLGTGTNLVTVTAKDELGLVSNCQVTVEVTGSCENDGGDDGENDDDGNDDDDDGEETAPEPVEWSINRRGWFSGDQCLPVSGRPNCIMSDDGGNYGRNIGCDLDLVSGSGIIKAEYFDVELNDDYFRLNNGPKLDTKSEIESVAMSAGDRLVWKTDFWTVRGGWLICLESENGGPELPDGEGSLETTMGATHISEGALFQVMAKTDIEITSLDVHLYNAGTHNVEVLTTVSDFSSFTSILNLDVNGIGYQRPVSLPDFASPITVPAGTSRYFWVRSSLGQTLVTEGNNVGDMYVQNNELAIYEGYVVTGGRAEGTYVFNTVVHYTY
mmetsp:Transcript_13606/g.37606  ORF Transcript_13606/g.37606 Transcript_13606/m.37606 type:complete len:811 (+) Transcript_13606:101-2533(+)|eukprot:CAMPEP_0168721838 /NCGR_PEP_ID=MMETSP0724-20121128/2292_1 /TAXON_ID=265536 /ORGANISM="Amphiprora sp., Strain CCMP467" /LENGTH=810 /DNA_ID=CAMNT_0008768499 /DNA_START=30 /DNA_END=2462 /DNA_ORIENTATION=+